MIKYEYKQFVTGDVKKDSSNIEALNILGQDGWKVIEVVRNNFQWIEKALLIREIKPIKPKGKNKNDSIQGR
jgi:hypothetical protein